MQLLGGVTSVFSRSEHEQVSTRREDERRENPFHRIVAVVTEAVAVQVESPPAWIVQLDPIRGFAVLVAQSARILCQELSDQHLGPQATCWKPAVEGGTKHENVG